MGNRLKHKPYIRLPKLTAKALAVALAAALLFTFSISAVDELTDTDIADGLPGLDAPDSLNSSDILYENDFSSDTALDGCEVTFGDGGSIYCADGELVFKASDTYPPISSIMFPSTDGKGCTFEFDLTVYDMLSGTGWVSLMFGGRDANAAYQFTLRPNAALSDSMEFSYRKSSYSWDVLKQRSLSSVISADIISPELFDSDMLLKADSTLHVLLAVSDTAAYAYINGARVLSCGVAVKNGSFGICSRGLRMKIDNVRVSGSLPELSEPADDFDKELYTPDTGIISAPVVLQLDSSSASAYTADSARAAITVFPVLSVGSALYSGESLSASRLLSERETLFKGLTIPAYSVNDAQTASLLAEYISDNAVYDAFVISRNITFLQTAIADNEYVRGVYDCSHISTPDVASVVCTLRTVGVGVVVLPQSADASLIRTFQNRMLTVWVKCFDTVSAYSAASLGCDGVIVSDGEGLISLFESTTEPTVMRFPCVISNRGETSAAPENTLRAFTTAAAYGADAVMTDVRLTKDGTAVLSYTDTTDAYEEVLSIVGSTLTELEALLCTDETAREADRITTLEALFDAAANEYSSLVLYLRLCDTSVGLLDGVLALSAEYGITDRTVIVTSDDGVAAKASANGAGVVYTGGMVSYVSSGSVCRAVEALSETGGTLAVSSSITSGELIRLQAAGIRAYLTSADGAEFESAVRYAALVLRSCSDVCGYPRTLYVGLDDGSRLSARLEYPNGQTRDVTGEAGFISLSGSASYSSGYVSGKGKFAFYYVFSDASGTEYRLVSSAMTTTGKDEAETSGDTGQGTENDGDNLTTVVVAALCVLVVGGFILFAVMYKRGKRTETK